VGSIPIARSRLLFQHLLYRCHCVPVNRSSIAAGADADVTGGAHYYLNPKMATSGWFARNIVGDPTNHSFTVNNWQAGSMFSRKSGTAGRREETVASLRKAHAEARAYG
jgi:hypothetical protein